MRSLPWGLKLNLTLHFDDTYPGLTGLQINPRRIIAHKYGFGVPGLWFSFHCPGNAVFSQQASRRLRLVVGPDLCLIRSFRVCSWGLGLTSVSWDNDSGGATYIYIVYVYMYIYIYYKKYGLMLMASMLDALR